MNTRSALLRFRTTIGVFMAALIASGLTAFPILTEMRLLTNWLGLGSAISPAGHTGMDFWILTLRFGLEDIYAHHPWIAYGTDWLAFGHIVIALFFVDPLIRPAESRPVLRAGIAACLLVTPLALVCGAIRGIPLYWQLIDCSFGLLGLIPLCYAMSLLRWIDPDGRTGR
ncbi:MAG TPA: hypothetical protein VGM73_17365 [Candidatus Didemnitutus sp.]